VGTVHDMRFVFVADAQAGREFLRRLTPHVDSAADWWQAGASWISVAISYTGLVALGVAEDSLRSFPEAFRVGMPAKLVGRWRSGAPLTLAPAKDDPELGADPQQRQLHEPERGARPQRRPESVSHRTLARTSTEPTCVPQAISSVRAER